MGAWLPPDPCIVVVTLSGQKESDFLLGAQGASGGVGLAQGSDVI